ncbi:MAG: hypothetical protein HZA32_08100 [Opitutae bacterium]|nr:hypothetical protein [Opitutae bacterium]
MFELGEQLVDEARKHARRRRTASYSTVRPGPATPLWNLLAEHLRRELHPIGAKVRLARYLGVPKQRLHNFLKGGDRMPDAELTLRLLHWLAEKRGGRDLSL